MQYIEWPNSTKGRRRPKYLLQLSGILSARSPTSGEKICVEVLTDASSPNTLVFADWPKMSEIACGLRTRTQRDVSPKGLPYRLQRCLHEAFCSSAEPCRCWCSPDHAPEAPFQNHIWEVLDHHENEPPGWEPVVRLGHWLISTWHLRI